jgi:hypothetical protein
MKLSGSFWAVVDKRGKLVSTDGGLLFARVKDKADLLLDLGGALGVSAFDDSSERRLALGVRGWSLVHVRLVEGKRKSKKKEVLK